MTLPSNKFGNLAEEKLFLQLAQKQPSFDNIRNIFEGNNFNWGLFLNYVQLSGLSPLIYKNFKENDLDALDIPKKIIEKLSNQYKQNLICIYKIWPLVIKFFNKLKENGISIIVFKGLVLSWQLYGDITLRKTTDLDIVVKDDDFNKILKIFANEISFDPRNQKFIKSRPFWFGGLINKKIELSYNKGLLIDCHLINEQDLARKIFNRAVTQTIDSLAIACFCPEDHFIFLVDHFLNDFFRDFGRVSLKTFLDIYNFKKTIPLNKARLIQTARELHLTRRFYLLEALFYFFLGWPLLSREASDLLKSKSSIKKILVNFVFNKLPPRFMENNRYQKKISRIFYRHFFKFLFLDTWWQRIGWLVTAFRLKKIKWQTRLEKAQKRRLMRERA